ncbi:ABC transporter permease [Mariniluteicoccus flavus]
MFKYLMQRVVTWIIMIFAATNLTYFLANWALDPESNYADRRPPIPPQQLDRMLREYNLSEQQPILERWWTWISGIFLHWDWGKSPIGDPINNQISYRIWISFELMLLATVLTVVIGVAIGVFTASRQYKAGDRFFQWTSIIAMNIHVVVASLIVVLLGIRFNKLVGTTVFYVAGSESPTPKEGFAKFVDVIQHLALPTVALVLIGYASYHFLQRALLLDNIGADFVRTARAKGLTKAEAIRRHALRASIIPVANSVAFSIPGIFSGAVITETLFAWKGMGSYFIETLNKNDIHGVVAVAAFGALMTAIGAILADIALVVLDPRVRVN